MVATALRTLLVACLVSSACLSPVAVASVATSDDETTTATSPESVEEPLTSGESFCRGERLHFEARHATADAGKTYEVRTATDRRVIAQLRLDENGSATTDTTALADEGEAREFLLTDENGDPVVVSHGRAERTGNVTEAKWTVRPSLCAAFPDDTVGVRDWPHETNLFVGGDVETVEITSETLNATELAFVFDGNPTDDGVRVDVTDRRTVRATFEYRHVGEHTFRVTADGGATATARLTMTTSGVPTTFVRDGVYRVGSDGTAQISLVLSGPNVVTVTASRGDVRVNATVRDTDGDENVTLRYDASALASVETGREPRDGTVAAGSGDRLLAVNASDGDGSRTPGRYELTSSVDGSVVDATMLVVESNETGSTATSRDSTTTERRETTAKANRAERETETTTGVPGLGVGVALSAIALAVGFGVGVRRKSG